MKIINTTNTLSQDYEFHKKKKNPTHVLNILKSHRDTHQFSSSSFTTLFVKTQKNFQFRGFLVLLTVSKNQKIALYIIYMLLAEHHRTT